MKTGIFSSTIVVLVLVLLALVLGYFVYTYKPPTVAAPKLFQGSSKSEKLHFAIAAKYGLLEHIPRFDF